MNKIVALLKLVRWINLIIVALILFLVKFCLVDPLSALAEIPVCLQDFQWLLLAVASVALAASGNVINDIEDQDIDRINKPDKMVVGITISETTAYNIYYGLSAIGIGAGIWLAETIGSDFHGAIFLGVAAALWFYSNSFKRKLLIGNLMISALGALLVLMPYFMEWRCQINDPMVAEAIEDHGAKLSFPWLGFLLAFTAFSFLTTFIREVIKDMQDMKGDDSEGARTLPITIGFTATKWVAITLAVLLITSVGYLMNLRLGVDDNFTFYYLAIAVQLPTLALIILLFTSKEPSDMAASSGLIKGIMLTGMLSMLVLRYSFTNA